MNDWRWEWMDGVGGGSEEEGSVIWKGGRRGGGGREKEGKRRVDVGGWKERRMDGSNSLLEVEEINEWIRREMLFTQTHLNGTICERERERERDLFWYNTRGRHSIYFLMIVPRVLCVLWEYHFWRGRPTDWLIVWKTFKTRIINQ